MSGHVLLSKLEAIRKKNFFTVMAGEYTNITSKEQFSFCIRTVDDNLEGKEGFLGFYKLENIESVTFVNAIKEILLRFNLLLRFNTAEDTPNYWENNLRLVSLTVKVTLSAWLLKILQRVVKYFVTL